MCNEQSPCVFEGPAIDCGLEAHMQLLVWQHVKPTAVVLELGARFGTVSCTIAKKQGYSGMLVSVDPDPTAFSFLQGNVERNGCQGIVVNGVVSADTPQYISAGSTYGSNVGGVGYEGNLKELAAAGRVTRVELKNYRVHELAHMLAEKSGRTDPVVFDTLVIDCERCMDKFMEDEKELMDSPALRTILYVARVYASEL